MTISICPGFFKDLELPELDSHLDVGSGKHAEQTATVMLRLKPVCAQEKQDAVIVVGDVNSTLACALVAAKLNIAILKTDGKRGSVPPLWDRHTAERIFTILADKLGVLR